MAVNGDPCRRRWWLGEWRFLTLLAGGSGQNPVLVEEATTTKLSPSLDDESHEDVIHGGVVGTASPWCRTPLWALLIINHDCYSSW
jgi:hypothetical protein